MEEQKELSALMKITLFGSMRSGKSSILKRLLGKIFNEKEQQTIGVECEIRDVVRDGVTLKRQIWDTAGDQRFAAITQAYFRNTNAYILVVDATQPLNEQLALLESAKTHAPERAKFYIAVNKYGEDGVKVHDDFKDLDTAKNSMLQKATEIGLMENQLAKDAIFFCSAKTGESVHELFNKATQDFVIDFKAHLEASSKDNYTPSISPIKYRPSLVKRIGDWWDKHPFHSKAWWVGNGAVAVVGVTLLTLAAFAVGSFLTFGVLPSAFIGAAILTAAAAIVWNGGCAIYDHFNKPPLKFLDIEHDDNDNHNDDFNSESSFYGTTNTSSPTRPTASENSSKPVVTQPDKDTTLKLGATKPETENDEGKKTVPEKIL